MADEEMDMFDLLDARQEAVSELQIAIRELAIVQSQEHKCRTEAYIQAQEGPNGKPATDSFRTKYSHFQSLDFTADVYKLRAEVEILTAEIAHLDARLLVAVHAA